MLACRSFGVSEYTDINWRVSAFGVSEHTDIDGCVAGSNTIRTQTAVYNVTAGGV
jgi:hypothetical protein